MPYFDEKAEIKTNVARIRKNRIAKMRLVLNSFNLIQLG